MNRKMSNKQYLFRQMFLIRYFLFNYRCNYLGLLSIKLSLVLCWPENVLIEENYLRRDYVYSLSTHTSPPRSTTCVCRSHLVELNEASSSLSRRFQCNLLLERKNAFIIKSKKVLIWFTILCMKVKKRIILQRINYWEWEREKVK